MKKLFVLFIAVVMLLASCGAPAETTAPEVTDAPEVTEAPETEAPETEAPETEAPETEAPETEAPETEAPKTEDGKTLLYSFDFENGLQDVEGFRVYADTFAAAEGGYKNTAGNGNVLIHDDGLKLVGAKTMVEADITFNVLPHKDDGVTNFPLSIISWIRKTDSTIIYDWTFKMDDQGNIFINNVETPAEKKVETGKRHTFGVLYDDEAHTAKVYLDGEFIGEKSYGAQTLIDSDIRIFDSGDNKARFTATLHSARAYVAE